MPRQNYGWLSDLAAKLGQANVMAFCLLQAVGNCFAFYYGRDLRWVFAVVTVTSLPLVLDRLIGCFVPRSENSHAYTGSRGADRPKESSKIRHQAESKKALASAARSVRK